MLTLVFYSCIIDNVVSDGRMYVRTDVPVSDASFRCELHMREEKLLKGE